jgi:acyl-CoA synthetase (NDP forming)
MKHKVSEASIPFTEKNDLTPFFEPKSVAVVGSFKKAFFGGYVSVKTMLNAGFMGNIYPVNPSYKEVLGLRVYPSIKDVPAKIELAVVIIGCQNVPKVIRQCAEKGVRAVIVVSDGFAERNEEGAVLQNQIVEIARQTKMRIIGPNTVGTANIGNNFNPNPYETGYAKMKAGGIAICSQTGVTSPQGFPYADLNYGVSKICDFGNKCDIDECDMLEYLESDASTKVIVMYLENIRDGRKFLQVSRRIISQKPVLIFKSGRTKEGARMSASHTGSLAVDDQIFDAACKQAGIIRLERFKEIFDLPKIFSCQPLPKGNRLGIVSITGGLGVVATDEGVRYGLSVSSFSPETVNRLNSFFPGLGKNAVDYGPVLPHIADYMSLYREILKAVLTDENTDCLLNVVWADTFKKSIEEDYGKIFKELKGHQKPIATWIYGSKLSVVDKITRSLEDLDFPVFPDPETAVKALGIASKYAITKVVKVQC